MAQKLPVHVSTWPEYSHAGINVATSSPVADVAVRGTSHKVALSKVTGVDATDVVVTDPPMQASQNPPPREKSGLHEPTLTTSAAALTRG
jgi:hypothetical protein